MDKSENPTAIPYPAGMSPIESLPPEIAEIIIKMLMRDLDFRNRHSYLVGVLAQVSSRFKALAALKSLWKGFVWIRGCESIIKQVAREFLSDGTIALHLLGEGEASISGYDIHRLASKCPKLEFLGIQSLKIDCLRAWKSAKWKSLKCITLGRNMPDLSLEVYPSIMPLFVYQGFDLDDLSINFTYHPNRCKTWGKVDSDETVGDSR